MSSEKQLQANRINALKAGVKSDEGKAVVRHNSFKHGLTSKELISNLKNYTETNEEFQEMVEGLKSTFGAGNYLEESLIATMAKAQLKMKRYDVLEATMYFDEMPPIIGESREVMALGNQDTFELLLKYKHSIESQFYRALETLLRSRQLQQLDLFLNGGLSHEKR
jgi:hypothetical protein